MAIEACQQGFSDVTFLDLFTHTKIEEVWAANFFGITKAGQFVTPKSPSIFPRVTRDASMFLAQNRLSMEVEMGDVYVDQLNRFFGSERKRHCGSDYTHRHNYSSRTMARFLLRHKDRACDSEIIQRADQYLVG